MSPSETPRYRLEVRQTDPHYSQVWVESYGTSEGPPVTWIEAVRKFRFGIRTAAILGYDDMVYRVVQA